MEGLVGLGVFWIWEGQEDIPVVPSLLLSYYVLDRRDDFVVYKMIPL